MRQYEKYTFEGIAYREDSNNQDYRNQHLFFFLIVRSVGLPCQISNIGMMGNNLKHFNVNTNSYNVENFTNHFYKSGIAERKDAKRQDQSENQITANKISNNISTI